MKFFPLVGVLFQKTYPSDEVGDDAIEPLGDEAEKTTHSKQTVGKGKRHMREIYNKGEGKQIRAKKRRLEMKHDSTKLWTTKQRKKCIVCCTFCTNGNHDDQKAKRYRDPFRTSYGCVKCAIESRKLVCATNTTKSYEVFQAVPLCVVPRFDTEAFGYDKRTCFQIHHDEKEYPELKCPGLCERANGYNFPRSPSQRTRRITRQSRQRSTPFSASSNGTATSTTSTISHLVRADCDDELFLTQSARTNSVASSSNTERNE